MSDEIVLAGLDQVGASIAMALRHAKVEVDLVGYDPDSKVAQDAVKAHIVDRSIGSLAEAPSDCDLYIVGLPSHDAIAALQAIAPRLPDGALVLGTSPVQSQVSAWAEAHFGPGRHYLAAFPVPGPAVVTDNETDRLAPRHDLFQGGLLALAATPGMPQAKLDVAISLARLLGAGPLFLDVAELDAAAAATEGLPALLSMALMDMMVREPGWRDMRRLTGSTFIAATGLNAEVEPGRAATSISLNRAHTLAKLGAYIAVLEELRDLLAQSQDEAFAKRYADAVQAHHNWLAARRKGDAGLSERAGAPPLEAPSLVERWFGGGRRRKS